MENQISKTVLIVDDEESIREFVGMILRKQGLQVLLAANGGEAMQISGEHPDSIDLLLSNVQMPGMTGLELGTKMQEQRPEIRIMLMSGFASGMLILNEGWYFLHKPFVSSQLITLVLNVLNAPYNRPPSLDEHVRNGGAPEAIS